MAAKLGLSSPWVIFYREVQALFKGDPEVHVVYDEEDNIIKVYVENSEKADLLAKVLPDKKTFGRVQIDLQVIPADGRKLDTVTPDNVDASLFEKIFAGNACFSFAKTYQNLFAYTITYVVFKCEVVQFFVDDISDIRGLRSTLFADVAKDIFECIFDFTVNFCTDVPEPPVNE